MHVRFEARGVASELELQPGTWTVGGAEDDGIRFPGLPPGVLELDLEGTRAWVRCTRPLRVGRAVLAPGVRRWLLPGERVRLSRRAQLRLSAVAEPAGTLALVRSLLEPGDTPVFSAAAALICVAGADAGTVFLLAGTAPEPEDRRHADKVGGCARRGGRMRTACSRPQPRYSRTWC